MGLRQWIVVSLVKLLPEQQREELLEYRGQLERQGITGAELDEVTWEGWWQNIGFLLNSLGDAPTKILRWVDPRYPQNRVYRRYGPTALAQLEEEYLIDAYRLGRRWMQFCGPLTLGFYAVLAILDYWCLPQTRPIAWAIRAVVCLVLSWATWQSFKASWFERYHQLLTAGTVLIAGFGMVMILVLAQPSELGNSTYYTGLRVLIMYINLGCGLRFWPAVLVTVLLIGSYEGTELLLMQGAFTQRLMDEDLLANSWFLIGDLIYLWVSKNLLARSQRISFMSRYTLSHSFRELLKYFEYQDADTLLAHLSQIRYLPGKLSVFLAKTYGSSKSLRLPAYTASASTVAQITSKSKRTEEQDEQVQPATAVPAQRILQRTKQFWHQSFTWVRKLIPSLFWQRWYTQQGGQANALIDAFNRDYFYGSVGAFWAVIVAATVNYPLYFTVVDRFSMPETWRLILPWRLGGGAVIFLLVVLTCWQKWFQRFYRLALLGAALYGGGSVLIMIALTKPSEIAYVTYYGGLIQTFCPLFFLCRVRFSYALPVSLFLAVSYEVIAITVQQLPSTASGMALLVNNSIFLWSALLVAAIAGNVLERNEWLEFLTLRSIADKAGELLNYYESERLTPRQLLDLINNIRHSPQALEKLLINLEDFKLGKS